MSPSSLHRAVKCGAVSRPTRGVLALHGTAQDAVVVAALGGWLTCVSLLRRWKVPLRESPASPHLCLSVDHHRATTSGVLRDVVIHRLGLVPDASARARSCGVSATTVATALEVASNCLTPLDHLIAADGALRMGLIERGDLFFTRRGTKARGRWLERYADSRADSLLETVARWALTDAGFRVESQVAIPGVGRVDLVVEDAIVVELDGREHHADWEAFAADRGRDRSLIAWGLKVLRFTYSDVLPAGTRVVEDVRAALAARSQPRHGLREKVVNVTDRG